MTSYTEFCFTVYFSHPTPVKAVVNTHIPDAVEIQDAPLPILVGLVLVHHYVPDPFFPIQQPRWLPVDVQGVPPRIQCVILLREADPMAIPLVNIISHTIRRHGRIPLPVPDLGHNVTESAQIPGMVPCRNIPPR